MWVAFAHFFSKNTCELDTVVNRTVNILTTNELVKVMTLWTTGPWCWLLQFQLAWSTHAISCGLKICEIRQNFKESLTKFCEIFLNITLELPHCSLKSFFYVRSLWKPQLCVIYVYFFIKYIVKWSENSLRFEFLWELLPRWAKFCEILSHSVRYGMYAEELLLPPWKLH